MAKKAKTKSSKTAIPTFTHLPPQVRKRLEVIAKKEHRSLSSLLAAVLTDYAASYGSTQA